jgi:hypothetical protein
MTIIAPPQFQFEKSETPCECEDACRETFIRLINDLASRGWRRKELAVRIADIADEYVLEVASQPRGSDGQPNSRSRNANA